MKVNMEADQLVILKKLLRGSSQGYTVKQLRLAVRADVNPGPSYFIRCPNNTP